MTPKRIFDDTLLYYEGLPSGQEQQKHCDRAWSNIEYDHSLIKTINDSVLEPPATASLLSSDQQHNVSLFDLVCETTKQPPIKWF